MQNNPAAITVLDGGMGQELVKRSKSPAAAMWSAHVMAHEPDVVRDLHRDFIVAGARVITLNTYSVTPERLARDGNPADFASLHATAAQLAQQAREQAGVEGVRIAACLPPLVASYRPELAPPYKEMLATYEQIMDVQANAAELVLCETMASLNDAKAAATVAMSTGLPVWVGLTVDDQKPQCLRSGEPLADAIVMLDEMGVHAKLINCSKPEAVSAAFDTLAAGDGVIGAYANGFTSIAALQPGGTVDALSARHDLGPLEYAEFALQWLKAGATLIGGCCEVGPAHIAALKKAVSDAGYQIS